MVVIGVSACVCLLASWAHASDKSVSEFKPQDVKSGEYPDYDKYVDMPQESLEQTLWRKVLRGEPNAPKVGSFSLTWNPNRENPSSVTTQSPKSPTSTPDWAHHLPSF
ncbi:hypothetical protein J6590_026619 [Homalodisca vitripennis]|nr:hypothetical protein J6590_026619 [Homalodisca vitripennis]